MKTAAELIQRMHAKNVKDALRKAKYELTGLRFDVPYLTEGDERRLADCRDAIKCALDDFWSDKL